jgi:hypothetical protein
MRAVAVEPEVAVEPMPAEAVAPMRAVAVEPEVAVEPMPAEAVAPMRAVAVEPMPAEAVAPMRAVAVEPKNRNRTNCPKIRKLTKIDDRPGSSLVRWEPNSPPVKNAGGDPLKLPRGWGTRGRCNGIGGWGSESESEESESESESEESESESDDSDDDF